MLIPNCAPIILLLGFGRAACPPTPPSQLRFSSLKKIRESSLFGKTSAHVLHLLFCSCRWHCEIYMFHRLLKKRIIPSNPRSPIYPSPSPPSRLFCTTGTYKGSLVRDRQSLHANSYIHMDASYLPVLLW
jgi:hypothetical protein